MPANNYVVPPLHMMLAFGASVFDDILRFNVAYVEEVQPGLEQAIHDVEVGMQARLGVEGELAAKVSSERLHQARTNIALASRLRIMRERRNISTIKSVSRPLQPGESSPQGSPG